MPEVLQPYMGGKTFIPFTKELPKGSTSNKQQAQGTIASVVDKAQKVLNI